MKKFNTLNEEINRIKQLLNVDNVLNEQTVTSITNFDSNDLKIYNLFTEYLKYKVPYDNNTLYKDRLIKLKSLTDNDLIDVIDFFKKKGYNPKNENIKHYQESLNISNFQNINKSSEFNDGVFGVATAKASLSIFINNLEKWLKTKNNDYSYNDNVTDYNKSIPAKAKIINKIEKPLPSKDVNINIGTQEIK